MLIDLNASYGGHESIQNLGLDVLRAQIARIPANLVFVHCRQGMTDASAANDQTLAVCKTDPRLRPVGVIDPRDTFRWEGEIARCLDAGVHLFRIYPDEGHWSGDSILFDGIVRRLDGTGAALAVSAATPGLPTAIAAATESAQLPVIFTEARYYPATELIPLARRYPHVFIETSRLITSPEVIERCVETLGADRLVFGSGTAPYPAAPPWETLRRADIAADEREAIAWRNAARLLRLDEHELAPVTDEPEPERVSGVIDIHLHDRFPATPVPAYTPAEYAAALAREGIIRGVCSSVTGIFYDIAQGNDEVARLIDGAPRVAGYVVVDPRYYDDSVQQLRRLESDPRFIGVKIHCAHAQTPTASPALRKLIAAIAEYEKPLLIHNLGEDWPEALVALAKAHPRLPIIAAHAGYGDGPRPTHDAALRVAPAENIVIEFCSTYLATGAIRRGIEAVGIDRVLFGSDFPLISLSYMRAAYADAELSEREQRAIYLENALRIFPTLAPHP